MPPPPDEGIEMMMRAISHIHVRGGYKRKATTNTTKRKRRRRLLGVTTRKIETISCPK